MSGQWWAVSNVDTTMTAPLSLFVRIHRDGGIFIASDFVGLRYGSGSNFVDAVTEWAHYVMWLITEPEDKLGGPLLDEARAYKRSGLDDRAAAGEDKQ